MAEPDLTGFMDKWKQMKTRWARTETYSTMVFSTAHLSFKDYQKLESLAELNAQRTLATLIVDAYPYGVRVYVNAGSKADWEALQERVLEADLGADAMMCITWGRESGCRWIEFDRDGPVYEEIPTHDWRAEQDAETDRADR